MAVKIIPEQVVVGEVIATAVSFEDYLERYAAEFNEWENGNVVKMSPVHDYHDSLGRYFAMLLEAYFEARAIGVIRQAPFVMRLPAPLPAREPDIQIILKANQHNLTPTYMNGAADICIEIVSPESIARDHGEKFEEYEKGGVSEYWIVDPLRHEPRFYRLNEDGVYIRYTEDADGNYRTPNLPGFVLHVLTLWQVPLPGPAAIVKMIQIMLGLEA